MLLVKQNKDRKVYKTSNSYLKTYTPNQRYDYDWLVETVKVIEKFMPGYVIDYGIKDNELYMDTKIIHGKTALELWEELIKDPGLKRQIQPFVHNIIDFCIEQYNSTKPYSHGDWALCNIIINQNSYNIIDWDNVLKTRTDEDVYSIIKTKLNKTLGPYFDFQYFDSKFVLQT